MAIEHITIHGKLWDNHSSKWVMFHGQMEQTSGGVIQGNRKVVNVGHEKVNPTSTYIKHKHQHQHQPTSIH
jgi:hypothetical protein